MRYWLIHIKDGEIVQKIPIKSDQITIGRSRKNDIVISNPVASGEHAVISITDRGAILEDLQSRNGTYVKNRRISKCMLKSGDFIKIQKDVFQFFSKQD